MLTVKDSSNFNRGNFNYKGIVNELLKILVIRKVIYNVYFIETNSFPRHLGGTVHRRVGFSLKWYPSPIAIHNHSCYIHPEKI